MPCCEARPNPSVNTMPWLAQPVESLVDGIVKHREFDEAKCKVHERCNPNNAQSCTQNLPIEVV